MKGSIFGVEEKRIEEKRIASPKEWAWLVGSLLLLIIVTVFREVHQGHFLLASLNGTVILLGELTGIVLVPFVLVAVLHLLSGLVLGERLFRSRLMFWSTVFVVSAIASLFIP